jgi:hypothetical protein
MLAAAMEEIPAGIFRERMRKQRTLQTAGYHHQLGGIEIFARLFFVPRARARRKRLQDQNSGLRATMARNATGVTGTLIEENRLYLGFEKFVTKRWRRDGWARRLRAQQARK